MACLLPHHCSPSPSLIPPPPPSRPDPTRSTPYRSSGGVWEISFFNPQHNHEPVEPEQKKYLRSIRRRLRWHNRYLLGTVRGKIKMRGVRFCYPSRPDIGVFNNFDLKVDAGKSLALIGTSGSGKSSVLALILRFFDPDSGKVLTDGKDIKWLKLASLRKHIGLVQQEPALFATTIYENILYGKEDATESEVIEASKLVNAHSFISALPEGYQTKVGERGVQLSGGQRQRSCHHQEPCNIAS